MDHIYEVGMGSDVQKVKAESAAAAAMFYGLYCIETNNPFMAVVYTEDGQKWEGDSYWLSVAPTLDHAGRVVGMLAEEIKRAEKVEDVE